MEPESDSNKGCLTSDCCEKVGTGVVDGAVVVSKPESESESDAVLEDSVPDSI